MKHFFMIIVCLISSNIQTMFSTIVAKKSIHAVMPLMASQINSSRLMSVTCKSPILEEFTELSLRLGSNVDALDKFGRTPLMIAAEKNNVRVMKILCEYSASINLQDPNGETALMYAARNGHEDALVFLASNGACLKIKNKEGKRAIDLIGVQRDK